MTKGLDDFGDGADGIFHMVLKIDADGEVEGHEDIDTGTETDESEFLILTHTLALFGVANDATRHHARHLADEDALAIVEEEAHLGALVEVGALGIGSDEIVTPTELDIFDGAVAGIAVDVHVGAGHKDGDLHAFVLDIVFLVDLLDGDDGAVGRGDEFGRAVGEDAARDAEEGRHQEAQDDEAGNKQIVDHIPLRHQQQEQQHNHEDDCAGERDDFLSFTMDSHWL